MLPSLNQLADLQDARSGLPIQSHRRLLGPAAVAAKELFRLAFRPFLNEALRKQAAFNGTLIDWLGAAREELERLSEMPEKVSQLERTLVSLTQVPDKLTRLQVTLEELVPLAAASNQASQAQRRHLEELPVEVLFTEGAICYLPENRSPEWFQHRNHWADLPLARLRPHLALFEYFLQRGPYPEEYFHWNEQLHRTRCVEPTESREALLQRRHREYLAMEQRLALGSWGDDWNVSVDYNPRGYFNIRDGHHRAAFFLARGRRFIPVRMTLGDRLCWAPLPKQRAVVEELDRIPGQPLYTPILAPLLYERLSERDVGRTRLEAILRHLGPERLSGKRLLDIGSNIGFYAQHFAREGALVTGVEPDPNHVRLAELLNDLFGVRYQIRREKFEDCELPPHEVGLMLTVFYHFTKEPQLRQRFLDRLNRSVTETLFWESGDQPEKEKEWILEGTHFDSYQKLCNTYGTGKCRELGVFRHERDKPALRTWTAETPVELAARGGC